MPDPFSNEYPSFAAHNNARLRRFLDRFGFEYEFLSATECYKAGQFDATLLRMLEVYDKVMDIILPTLGPERRATYSPFLPVSPTTGKVLQVPMVERDAKAGTIVYVDPDTGEKVETSVTGGAVKCQWKADWAMRWTRARRRLRDVRQGPDRHASRCPPRSAARSARTPPENFIYELFLDESGGKISKSKGNGLTVDEWLTYASPESLSLFMYQKPKAAKRLFFDVIPKTVDEYLAYLAKYPERGAEGEAREPGLAHPRRRIRRKAELPISFALLLNLVSVSNAEDKATLWGFIRKYAPDATPAGAPGARSSRRLRARLLPRLREAGEDLSRADRARSARRCRRSPAELGKVAPGASGEELQNIVYAVGKAHAFEPLRAWFSALYEVLLGQAQGPRFGGFIELYGVDNTRGADRARARGRAGGQGVGTHLLDSRFAPIGA